MLRVSWLLRLTSRVDDQAALLQLVVGLTWKAHFVLTIDCIGKPFFGLAVYIAIGCTRKAHFGLAVGCTGSPSLVN